MPMYELILLYLCAVVSHATSIFELKPNTYNALLNIGIPILSLPKGHTANLDQNIYTTTEDIIKTHGYPVERYVVVTDDGYVLTVHRIAGSPRSSQSVSKRPVLIMHGLFAASDSWVVLGPGASLGFLLADRGYDVWLGNARGNFYSRKHVSLSPKDPEFWNFWFHEMGAYDLPATIDLILNVTCQQQIFYFGHSMGTSIFFVMASIRPEYNQKIRLMVALAPIAHIKQIRSPWISILKENFKDIYMGLKRNGVYEILRRTPQLQQLIGELCIPDHPTFQLCLVLYFATFGGTLKNFNTISSMSFYIQNPTTGFVLDIKDGNKNSDATICMWPYTGAKNQLWEIRNGQIISKLNGLALDLSGADNKSVIMYGSHGRTNQRWTFHHDGTIQNGTGKVLDIRGGSRNQGAEVIAWTKTGSWNQVFRKIMCHTQHTPPTMQYTVTTIGCCSYNSFDTSFNSPDPRRSGFLDRRNPRNALRCISNMTFYIENPTTGFVLDIKNGNKNSEATICMWPYTGAKNQLWEIRNGQIISKLNGLALDLSGADNKSVIMYGSHGRTNQRWTFHHDGTIQNGTGKVLDIRGGSRNQGAEVIAWTKTGSWNQVFRKVSC